MKHLISLEDWKEIEGTKKNDRCYFVSNRGRIKSVFYFPSGEIFKENIFSPYPSKSGYSTVKIKYLFPKKLVHRFVANAFIPNPENKPQVNHKNGVKNDNRVENLEWVTSSENIIHSRRILRKCIGEKHHKSKLSDNDCLDIKSLRFYGASIKSLMEIYSVSQATIFRVISGERSFA